MENSQSKKFADLEEQWIGQTALMMFECLVAGNDVGADSFCRTLTNLYLRPDDGRDVTTDSSFQISSGLISIRTLSLCWTQASKNYIEHRPLAISDNEAQNCFRRACVYLFWIDCLCISQYFLYRLLVEDSHRGAISAKLFKSVFCAIHSTAEPDFAKWVCPAGEQHSFVCSVEDMLVAILRQSSINGSYTSLLDSFGNAISNLGLNFGLSNREASGPVGEAHPIAFNVQALHVAVLASRKKKSCSQTLAVQLKHGMDCGLVSGGQVPNTMKYIPQYLREDDFVDFKFASGVYDSVSNVVSTKHSFSQALTIARDTVAEITSSIEDSLQALKS